MNKGFIFVYDALFALVVVGVFLAGITAITPTQTESNALLLLQPSALDKATIRIHNSSNAGIQPHYTIKVCEETIKYNSNDTYDTIQSCRGIK